MLFTLLLTFLSVLLNICSQVSTTSFKTGACFLKKTPRGCKSFIGYMSRSKCCQQEGYFVREPNEGQLFLVTFLNQHTIPNCERSCSEDYCESKSCPDGEFCIMKETSSICSSDCKCSQGQRMSGPVCTDNGRRYKNMCELHLESCWTNVENTVVPCRQTGCERINCQKKNKKCVLTLQGQVKCVNDILSCANKIYDPICGVDNITYSNQCDLKKASINNGLEIQVAYKGVCREDANCNNVECQEPGMSCVSHHSHLSPVCVKCPMSMLDCENNKFRTYELLCLSTKYETRNTCYKDYLSCQNNVFIEVLKSESCLLQAKWPRK